MPQEAQGAQQAAQPNPQANQPAPTNIKLDLTITDT